MFLECESLALGKVTCYFGRGTDYHVMMFGNGLIAYFLWQWTHYSLQWRHNERDGVLNHQPHHCLLNRLLRCRSKKTSKLCVTGRRPVNSPHKWPVTQKIFPFNDVIMSLPYWQPPPQLVLWEPLRPYSRGYQKDTVVLTMLISSLKQITLTMTTFSTDLF